MANARRAPDADRRSLRTTTRPGGCAISTRSILKDSAQIARAGRGRQRCRRRLDVRPGEGVGGQRGVVALRRFAVLGRSQPADDRRGRARARCSRETALPRGVAYLAIGAPHRRGDWSVRGAMSEGDLSSWIVAGSFLSKATGGRTRYDLGLSYSTQEYQGGNPAALAAVSDGSRNVGELYALRSLDGQPGRDRRVRRALRALRLSRSSPGSSAPAFGVSLEPFPKTTVRAALAQRMVAPGAEEFLPTNAPARGSRPSARSRRCRRRDLRAERGALPRLRSRARLRRRLRRRRAAAFSRASTISSMTIFGLRCPAARVRSATTTWPARERSMPTAGACA